MSNSDPEMNAADEPSQSLRRLRSLLTEMEKELHSVFLHD